MKVRMALLLLAIVAGCTSMRSTSLTRQDDDSYVHNEKVPTPGVPVTVKVPSHLELAVVETLYFYDADKEDGQIDLRRLDIFKKDDRRNIKVKSEIIKTEKVITVDFKRPAAGSLEYNLGFDTKEQYITQIETFLYDRTLEDAANLIAQVVPGALEQTPGTKPTPEAWSTSAHGTRPDPNAQGPTVGEDISTDLMIKERVVAIARFDINACDFEEQVTAFLEYHVNACHSCTNDMGYPPSSVRVGG